jgi:hypothetical protein
MGGAGEEDYLAREAKARVEIDKQLAAAGCSVQSQKALNLSAGPGVAVRDFTPEPPHGRGDYSLRSRNRHLDYGCPDAQGSLVIDRRAAGQPRNWDSNWQR